jgi:hypothetical protein
MVALNNEFLALDCQAVKDFAQVARQLGCGDRLHGDLRII